MSETRPVLLVGHCGPDARMLGSAIRRIAPNAAITAVDDEQSLRSLLTGGAVLMVNRVLDGDFSEASGLDMILRLKREPNPPVFMLISNHEDAQAQAMAAGAVRGFGKLRLHTDDTAGIIRNTVVVNHLNDQPRAGG